MVYEILVSTGYGVGAGLIVGLAGYLKNDAKTGGFLTTKPDFKKVMPIMLSSAVTGGVAGYFGVTPSIAVTMPITGYIGIIVEKVYKIISTKFKK